MEILKDVLKTRRKITADRLYCTIGRTLAEKNNMRRNNNAR